MAGWKQAHANAAEHALKHPLVQDVMQEFLHNIGRPNGALERYGLTKIASYAAQVARAEALGIDPEALRADDEEGVTTMPTEADRDLDAGYRALERPIRRPLANVLTEEAVARLALELERLRERMAALEAALTARGGAGEGEGE